MQLAGMGSMMERMAGMGEERARTTRTTRTDQARSIPGRGRGRSQWADP